MRIQVNISEVMLKKLDKYVELMGCSRSSLCSQFIAQGLVGWDKAFSVLEEIRDSAINDIKSSVLEDLDNDIKSDN